MRIIDAVTLLAPEPTVEHAAMHPTRPFRWRTYVAALVVAVIAGATILWLGTYRPLTTETGGYGFGVLTSGGYESVELNNSFGMERRIIEPAPGDEIGLLFPLHNEGRLGVTIVSIGQPFNPTGSVGSTLHPDETTPGHAMRPTDPSEQHWVDVTPFALPAGDSVQIRVTFAIRDCATELTAPGSVNSAATVPVTYRVLGTTHTVDVPLPYAVSIESLPHCPYPA